MNGAQLVDRCEERYGDTGNAIVTAAEWLSYVNSAYRTFLRVSKWPSMVAEETVVVLANDRSVALPTASLNGGVLDVLVDDIPLEKQPEDLPIRDIRHWSDRPTSPIWYQVRGKRVSVLPAVSSNTTLTISYLIAPTALVAGGSPTSPVIPETYHDALVSGALAQAYRDDGNPELASHYQGEFDAMAGAAARDNGVDR